MDFRDYERRRLRDLDVARELLRLRTEEFFACNEPIRRHRLELEVERIAAAIADQIPVFKGELIRIVWSQGGRNVRSVHTEYPMPDHFELEGQFTRTVALTPLPGLPTQVAGFRADAEVRVYHHDGMSDPCLFLAATIPAGSQITCEYR